ncbi:MAG: DUF2333 family protein [Desulfosarcina sp.]|nr:DUF2333 family protein [Desulfobacterales bacterium]
MKKLNSVPGITLVILLTITVLWIFFAASGFFDKDMYEHKAHTYKTSDSPISCNNLKSDQQSHITKQDLQEHSTPVRHIDKPSTHQATEDACKAAPKSSPKVVVKGVAFVSAAITPLEYELKERFWGWRPNDIINVTDNVNNFQLGILETTRRTVVILTERISRTGSSAAFNVHLEHAMNWFMIKADKYWFPSPESKYRAGLKELKSYRDELEKHRAFFYTRADNLLPLLMTYEDLLGSCDENLIKTKEEDGTQVSFFQADDYFFYAKGVASAMVIMLEAIEKDFHGVIESRNGLEVLHHAHMMCETASNISPWIIINGDMDGILANHRANIAASISHARFYIGVLIKILST